MRRAAKVDDNQGEIVEALLKFGASVESLAALGNGVPDLLVGWRNLNFIMECKDGDRCPSEQRLTPKQEAFFARWRGQKAVVRYPEEALAVLGTYKNGGVR